MTARDKLAAQQAALLRAVLAGGEPPPGFDADRVHIEADALLAKRRRVVAHLRPDLADTLGERFAALFDRYATANPRRVGARARDDAAEFAGWLAEQRVLDQPRRRLFRR